jgi:putative endonuclease
MMFKLLYVYILKCADGSYYTGMSSDPDKRLDEHNAGLHKKSYTYSRRPLELVYAEQYWNFNDAIAREKQIKGWTRVKKEALIKENYDKLKELAACKNQTSHLDIVQVSSFGSAQDDTETEEHPE